MTDDKPLSNALSTERYENYLAKWGPKLDAPECRNALADYAADEAPIENSLMKYAGGVTPSENALMKYAASKR